MKINTLYDLALEKYNVSTLKEKEETSLKWLLFETLEISELDFLLNEKDINLNKANLYLRRVDTYLSNMPIQYILKKAYFLDLELYVNKNVLIPRFLTEELVKYTLDIIKDKSNLDILDLCTGSGCIGLSIKKYTNHNVYLADISSKALAVAKINAKKYNLQVKIIKSDLFSNINKKFDLIISNPPYLDYKSHTNSLVKNNEPSLALYALNNGLEFYHRIIKDVKNYLNKGGWLCLEHNFNQHEEIKKIANQYLVANVFYRLDLNGYKSLTFINLLD